MAQQFSCADRSSVLLFRSMWASLMCLPFAAWYLLVPPSFAEPLSLALSLQESLNMLKINVKEINASVFWHVTLPWLIAMEYKVYYPTPYLASLFQGAWIRNSRVLLLGRWCCLVFDVFLDGWLVHRRSFSLGPTGDVLCSRLCEAQTFL